MLKDKVVITVIATIVFFAIIFGLFMAYRTYKLPMMVDDIDESIKLLKNNSNKDCILIMERLAMFNELSRSCKMRNKKTGEIRKFSKEEMKEIYNIIGGKETVIQYLNNIEDEKQKREELEYACYTLNVITSDELSEIWNQR